MWPQISLHELSGDSSIRPHIVYISQFLYSVTFDNRPSSGWRTHQSPTIIHCWSGNFPICAGGRSYAPSAFSCCRQEKNRGNQSVLARVRQKSEIPRYAEELWLLVLFSLYRSGIDSKLRVALRGCVLPTGLYTGLPPTTITAYYDQRET